MTGAQTGDAHAEPASAQGVLDVTRQRLDELAAAHRASYPWPEAPPHRPPPPQDPASYTPQLQLPQQHFDFDANDNLTVTAQVDQVAGGRSATAQTGAAGDENGAAAANAAPDAAAAAQPVQPAAKPGHQHTDHVVQPQMSAPDVATQAGSPRADADTACDAITEPNAALPSQQTAGADLAASTPAVHKAAGAAAAPVGANGSQQPTERPPTEDAACAALLEGVTQAVGQCLGRLRQCSVGELQELAGCEEEVSSHFQLWLPCLVFMKQSASCCTHLPSRSCTIGLDQIARQSKQAAQLHTPVCRLVCACLAQHGGVLLCHSRRCTLHW